MTEKWFYRAGENDLGPFSVEEMKEHAARGELGPEDLVWPEGGVPEDGMAAEQAIDFSTLMPSAPSALPDWLEDVQKASEDAIHRPELPSPDTIPAWLQELMSEPELEPPAEYPPAAAEEPAPHAEPTPEEIEEEVAALFLFESPEEEASPAPTEAEVEATDAALEPPPPAPKVSETSRRITESAQEAWHRARVALERWIDLDSTRALVLDGDDDALRQNLVVQEIINPLQRFGPVLVDRLVQHLAFLAENRRKYYQAMAKRHGQRES